MNETDQAPTMDAPEETPAEGEGFAQKFPAFTMTDEDERAYLHAMGLDDEDIAELRVRIQANLAA